jgi:hypothetical protein
MEESISVTSVIVSRNLLILDHFFGVAIIGVVFLQGIARSCYARFIQGKSSQWVSLVDLSLGYTTIICGIINCGFGLLLAKIETKWAIIWWICGSGFVVLYLAAFIIQRRIQKKRQFKHEGTSTPARTRYGNQEYERGEAYDLDIPSQRYQQSEQYNRLNYGRY